MLFLVPIFSFLLSSSSLAFQCPNVTTMDNLNLTEYVKENWYIQRQQITPYLPLNSNYCVTARYSISNKTVPFYKGKVINVYNNARLNSVNGSNLNSNNNTLCARINGKNSKLLVAPCFLPNIFAGDYWILLAGPCGDNYQYAIVSGGQPNKKYKSGCSTSIKTINESGLWILTRNQTVSDDLIEDMITFLVKNGITTSLLNKVEQKKCIY